MKKTILTIVLATLCLNFSNTATAQTPTNQPVDVTAKGIQVGQKLPDDLLVLDKYKGKLIILDFWATWCSPCIAMFPKMEALQKQFNSQIQVVPVTYQAEKDVLTFIDKKNQGKRPDLPLIMGDKQLHKLFPHIYLPHYVWIDKSGMVRAITGSEELTENNIKMMLSDPMPIKQKKDISITYDSNKPLLINGNGGNGEQLLYHSMLSKYLPGLSSEYKAGWINGDQSFRIKCSNMSLLFLYKYAYSGMATNMGNRFDIQVKDQTGLTGNVSGEAARIWLEKYAYSYELVVPKSLYPTMLLLMQEDMRRLFPQYLVVPEKRSTKVLALTRVNKQINIASKSAVPSYSSSPMGLSLKGGIINTMINNLNSIYLQHLKIPVIDQTGISGPVDLTIDANLSDVKALNAALEKYGLKFIETEQAIDILILKDNPDYTKL